MSTINTYGCLEVSSLKEGFDLFSPLHHYYLRNNFWYYHFCLILKVKTDSWYDSYARMKTEKKIPGNPTILLTKLLYYRSSLTDLLHMLHTCKMVILRYNIFLHWEWCTHFRLCSISPPLGMAQTSGGLDQKISPPGDQFQDLESQKLLQKQRHGLRKQKIWQQSEWEYYKKKKVQFLFRLCSRKWHFPTKHQVIITAPSKTDNLFLCSFRLRLSLSHCEANIKDLHKSYIYIHPHVYIV